MLCPPISSEIANGLDDYARQMCVEDRDEYGLWQCPSGKPNHLWDCEQMAVGLALHLGFSNMIRPPREEETPAASTTQQPTTGHGTGLPSWFQNRGR